MTTRLAARTGEIAGGKAEGAEGEGEGGKEQRGSRKGHGSALDKYRASSNQATNGQAPGGCQEENGEWGEWGEGGVCREG